MRPSMRNITTVAAVCALMVGVASVTTRTQSAQRAGATKARQAPRTTWGHPDLQGVWDFSSHTPLQRAPEFGTRAELTDAEVQEHR